MAKKRPTSFVIMPWEMLDSKAYQALTGNAAKALPLFLFKVKVRLDARERYTTEFTFPYSEAKAHGFCNGTFSKIISELVNKGFIDVAYRGGKKSAYMTSSRFKLSRRWESYGTPQFEQILWEEIYPGELAKARSPDRQARLKGRAA